MNFLPYFPRAFSVKINAHRGNLYYLTLGCRTIRGYVHHIKITVMVDGHQVWPCDTVAGTKQWYPIKTVDVNIWAGMLLKRASANDKIKRTGKQYGSMSELIQEVHERQPRRSLKIRSAWFC